MIRCKYCPYCKQHGKQKSILHFTTRYSSGRKHYWCTHPNVKDVRDIFDIVGGESFIGFGENTFESPLVVKKSPRWCPRKKLKKENKENN